ncbi:MAG: radical SAM protein [Desulfovibrio sp.]|nr:radical SAM protein [Desulfovibrio sp.]
MKAYIKSLMRALASRIYGISSRADWRNFKRNTIDFLYYYGVEVEWSALLTNERALKFFSRFKDAKKLSSLYYTLRFLLTRKPVAPIIEYVVTTHCTMKCKHCNTKVPYFTQDTHVRAIDFDTFKRDVERLLSGVDYVLLFGFVGGEPLLARELPKMVDFALKQKKIHSVFIASNCTLLPSPELLEAMQNKKFSIQISDYRRVANLPPGITCRHDEVKDLLLKNSINFNDVHEKADGMTWASMPELRVGRQDPARCQDIFNRCFGRECNMLCDGKILQCTISAYISRNMELIEEIEKELVDIRTSTDVRRDMVRFYCRPYSAFCHYCHHEHRQWGLPCGEQLESEAQ